MDEIDKNILNEIQSNFPIDPRPYCILGKRLDLPEDEIIKRIKRLKEEGVVRRIGANFRSERLNFASTLCAAKVPEELLENFIDIVNHYPGVTHNYLRNHNYNVWFTFIAEDMDYINTVLKNICEKTGVREILNLPAIRMFKIKVDFEV